MPVWPDTPRQQSLMTLERANADGWAAIQVADHSAAVEALLIERAAEEGLEVSPSTGGFTRSLWLAWRHKKTGGQQLRCRVAE